MHDPLQPRQTQRTPLAGVPLKRRSDAARQRTLLAVGVTLSSLVIVGLYAASFRYQRVLASADRQAQPRWGVLNSDAAKAIEALRQQSDAISSMRQSFDAAASAQAQSMAIMKGKIEASATATTQTK